MAGFVPLINICVNMNFSAFKLIFCFNSATSYTRNPLFTIHSSFFTTTSPRLNAAMRASKVGRSVLSV